MNMQPNEAVKRRHETRMHLDLPNSDLRCRVATLKGVRTQGLCAPPSWPLVPWALVRLALSAVPQGVTWKVAMPPQDRTRSSVALVGMPSRGRSGRFAGPVRSSSDMSESRRQPDGLWMLQLQVGEHG